MKRMNLPAPVLFVCVTLALSAGAHEEQELHRLDEAIERATIKIETATAELNDARSRISEERKLLARELDPLFREVKQLRDQAGQRRARQNRIASEREVLVRELETLRENHEFARSTLREYRRSFETRLGITESVIFAAQHDTIDKLDSGLADPVAFVALADHILTFAERANGYKLGGSLHDGKCLDEDGVAHSGRFVQLGPLAWFAADEGGPVGLVVSRMGSSLPSLHGGVSPETAENIRSVLLGEEAALPLDPSGGDALRGAAARPGLWEHLAAGGIVMIPLLLIGLVAAVVTVWKFAALRAVSRPSGELLDEVTLHLRAGEEMNARSLVAEMSRPFCFLLEAGIEYRGVRKDHLEEILHERALSVIPELERNLGLLAVSGAVAPLLGLLGTVTGMIHTFQMVTVFGTGDAKLLSGGISEALVTTETGLVIAVPVLLVHALLNRRVRGIIDGLEQTLVAFVNRLHAEPGRLE